MQHHKIYTMSFAKVYHCLVAKAEKKKRTKSEVDEVIGWLTGYNPDELDEKLQSNVEYKDFFADAPALNPARASIKGVICGVRIEDIQEPLMREIRYLDKLVDELAKGKSMDKVLRRQ